MATHAQVRANRRNAQKSTGPKTIEGKQLVSRNAITHGLLSNDGIFLNEDPAAFTALSENLRTQLVPVGEIEKILVDGIIWTVWRLRRVPGVEAAWHSVWRYAYTTENIVGYDHQSLCDGITKAVEERYAAALAKAPASDRAALRKEIQQEAQCHIENAASARSWRWEIRNDLSRYEQKLDRRLRKLLAELETRQKARPPETVRPIHRQLVSTDPPHLYYETSVDDAPVVAGRFGETEK